MRRKLPPRDIRFDPEVEISPYALFRRFKEGRAPVLIDMRAVPGQRSFLGAIPWLGPEWTPPEDSEVVLFDDDGADSIEISRGLQAAGFPWVRSLFGGLELYDFSLDPAVVGEERFLKEPST
jgi:hypothetical protein